MANQKDELEWDEILVELLMKRRCRVLYRCIIEEANDDVGLPPTTSFDSPSQLSFVHTRDDRLCTRDIKQESPDDCQLPTAATPGETNLLMIRERSAGRYRK